MVPGGLFLNSFKEPWDDSGVLFLKKVEKSQGPILVRFWRNLNNLEESMEFYFQKV